MIRTVSGKAGLVRSGSRAGVPVQVRGDHGLHQGCRSECGRGGWVPQVSRVGKQWDLGSA